MKIPYRKEIDSLRALAVLAVIIYHAKIPFFGGHILSGGYIGVDIFFVISGYLITYQIIEILNSKKKFLFLDFYEKRVRRILPALIFVIIASTFLFKNLIPDALINFIDSLIFVSLFLSNFFFYFTGLKYGAEHSLNIPYLHTWSLAVEFQFYIIIPLLIYLIFKLKKNITKFLILLFLFSLLFSIFFKNHYDTQKSFYLFEYRLWEFLAGSIVYIFEKRFKYISFLKKFSKVFFYISILVIFSTFLLLNEKTINSAYLTLIPIISVMLFIFFFNHNFFFAKIISSSFIVYIGKISYSLYLWHYPIFAYLRINWIEKIPISEKFIIIFLLFIVSHFTYKFIEQPFRKKNFFSFKKLLYFYIFFILILIFFNFFTKINNGFNNRFIIKDEITNVSIDVSSFNKFNLINNFTKNNLKNKTCNRNYKNILIIGNSHGEDTFASFQQNKDLFLSYNFFYQRIEISDFYTRINYDKSINCFDESDIIFLSTRWSANDILVLPDLLDKLKGKNKSVIIFNNTPEFPQYKMRYNNFTIPGATIFVKFIIDNNRFPNIEEVFLLKKKYYDSLFSYDYEKKNINVKIFNISQKKKLPFIDKVSYLCSHQYRSCEILTTDGQEILYDYGHYNLNGSKYIGKAMSSDIHSFLEKF